MADKHRLCIDFRTAEEMMEWFEDARLAGVFGYDTIELDDGLEDQRPRKNVGVRVPDSIDDRGKVERHLVSGTRDPGYFVTLKDVPSEPQAVVEMRRENDPSL